MRAGCGVRRKMGVELSLLQPQRRKFEFLSRTGAPSTELPEEEDAHLTFPL